MQFVPNNSLRVQPLNQANITSLYSLESKVIGIPIISITWRAGDIKAKKDFSNFGHLITRLDVDVTEPYDDFLRSIVEKCEPRLRHLSLWLTNDNPIPLIEDTKMKLKLLFSRLHRLDLYGQTFFNLDTTRELLASCLSLNWLSLNCTNTSDFEWNKLSVNFPNLQELIFYVNLSINDDGFELLLSFNPNIKRLYLDECTNLTPKTFGIIVRYLPNLEEISLGYLLQKAGTAELWSLGELKRLKRLTVILGPALPLIHVMSEAVVPIENLMLWHANVTDALVEKLLNMKTIKNLAIHSNEHVTSYTTDVHLQLLGEHLPNLSEFRLTHSDRVTIDGHQPLVTIDGLKYLLLHAKKLTLLTLINMKNISIANKDDLLHCIDQRSNLTIEIG